MWWPLLPLYMRSSLMMQPCRSPYRPVRPRPAATSHSALQHMTRLPIRSPRTRSAQSKAPSGVGRQLGSLGTPCTRRTHGFFLTLQDDLEDIAFATLQRLITKARRLANLWDRNWNRIPGPWVVGVDNRGTIASHYRTGAARRGEVNRSITPGCAVGG